MSPACPNCHYERQPSDAGPPGECPHCGVVYEKFRGRLDVRSLRPPAAAPAYDDAPEPPASVSSRLLALVFGVSPVVSPATFFGHAAVYVLLFLWSWRFLLLDYRDGEINGSFMHNINLVFHEAGHVIFRPFGDFMTVLGGSLGQLLVPLVVAAAFLFKNRDPFGASVGVWWLGVSFKDLAPYIYDASRLVMPLLGGVTGADVPGYHDWNNILVRLDMLWADHIIARWSDRAGAALIATFLVWGGYTLYREYRNLDHEA